MDESRNETIRLYKEIVKKKKEKPNYADFLSLDVTRDMIRRRFGGIENLHQYMRENHTKFLEQYFSSVESVFSKERDPRYSEKKRFVITTAVADTEAHLGFLSAIDTYCRENDAAIVIMPAESVTNSFENSTAIFDKVFNDPKYLFVQSDTALNDNLFLCSIQVSAKQIKPITGLSRLGHREGSYVFASPKQFLEYVPSGNSRGKNYSIMTPGACTVPSYYSEVFVSKRLSYIAERDHTMGAIIVEIEDDKYFHFRQVQCDHRGDFADLGVMYTSDGKTYKVPVNVVYGDLHAAQVNEDALSAFNTLFADMQVKNLFLHDVFDGNSVNHHIQTIAEKQQRVLNDADCLATELRETFYTIRDIENIVNPEKVYIVKSNHDEFLTRYLAEGRYVNDPTNHYISLKIAPALFEGEDVLARAFTVVDLDPQRWTFLTRESTYKIGGVELASHGDLGLNGALPSLNSLEKIYGDCVVAHNHTPAIQRGVFRVGTLTNLDMGYNRGPSSWMHTCCIVYDNGQRQLVNYVNGKCKA